MNKLFAGQLLMLIFTISLIGCSDGKKTTRNDTQTETDTESNTDSATGSSNDTHTADRDTGTNTETEPVHIVCGNVICEVGQYCDETTEICIAATCEILTCSPTEECTLVPNGAICASIACDNDDDCPIQRYCDTDQSLCQDDICLGGERTCVNETVMVCTQNGGMQEEVISCTPSQCLETGVGLAGCKCEGSWHCQGYQTCEQGICVGPIEPPTCRLEPIPLSEVLPAIEIKWGGINENSTAELAAGLRALDGVDLIDTDFTPSPWSAYGQVVQTPLVANLNDDNGDGKIDSSDVAEIIFIAFQNASHVTADGVLRAISGGGKDADGNRRKGRDLLAVCGENRFYNGNYYDAADQQLDTEPACAATLPELDATSTLAVGDVDFDGTPEIIAIGEDTASTNASDFGKSQGSIYIFTNYGKLIAQTELIDFSHNAGYFRNPGPSIANVIPSVQAENELAEIVVGRDLFILDRDNDGNLVFVGHQYGVDNIGANVQGPVSCVADLIPERLGMEIVAGGTVYGIPLTNDSFEPTATELTTLAHVNNEGFCGIADVWGANPLVAPGVANPLDGEPEIILISAGVFYVYRIHHDNNIYSLELLKEEPLPDANNQGGGAPNIDDFDGDGFPEVGTAAAAGYVVFDLQAADTTDCPAWESFGDNQFTAPRLPPDATCTTHADCGDTAKFACGPGDSLDSGRCICFHNGWMVKTQDASSRVTGSSVFDFNGDGAAEVIYNDECHFRIYNGRDGIEHMIEPSESRTRIEYPIVADIDNDGNAEIIFSTTNESKFCTDRGATCTGDTDCPSGDNPLGQQCIGGQCQLPNREVFNNGIEVWGDPQDLWVSARRIWNQHAYHVTNVTESGGIPLKEHNSWVSASPALYNSYRSQPRSFGVAPDLKVTAAELSSPNASCGTLSTSLDISIEIANQGDLRGGGGAQVVIQGTWDATTEFLKNDTGELLTYTLDHALFAGQVMMVSVPYAAVNNNKDTLPDSIHVIIDPPSNLLDSANKTAPHGAERECNETNNTLDQVVDGGQLLADLRIAITSFDAQCPTPGISGTVYNDGTLDASNVQILFTAGHPSQGGESLIIHTIDLIPAGATKTFIVPLTDFPTFRTIQVYAVVDPANTIEECNNANNQAGPTEKINCGGVVVE